MRTRRTDCGASLVEYALLLALIAVVAIGALVFLGNSASNTLNQVANSVNSTTGSRPTSPVHSLGNTTTGQGNLASFECSVNTATTALLTGTCSSYSWLDGFYYYYGTQWYAIVTGDSSPASGTVGDQWAYQFQTGYLAGQNQSSLPDHAWSCDSSSNGYCNEVVFNPTSTLASPQQGDVAES